MKIRMTRGHSNKNNVAGSALCLNALMQSSSSCDVISSRLTLELSGGEAVRLERVVRPHDGLLARERRIDKAYLLEIHRKLLAT